MPKLTDRFIQSFRPAEGAKDRLAFDTECRGLGIRATANGNRVFLVQWTDAATGRKVREPLGAWGSLTVDQAREAARVRLGKVAQGLNPKAEREKTKAEDTRRRAEEAQAKQEARYTLETLIEEWARLHLSGRRPSYAAEAQRALRNAFASHLVYAASSLSRSDVVGVLDALAAAGKAPIASRTLAYGRACYGWAVKRGRLGVNPFADLPVIAGGAPSRDRVLTDAELGALWRAAGTLGFPFRPVVRLLLLTAARREEVAGMGWSELSADLSTWTLPKERAKNGRAHVVHLPEAARAELRLVPRIDGRDLVFTVTGKTPPSGFSKAKLALMTAMKREAGDSKSPSPAPATKRAAPALPEWRYHDFRRTAVTWLAGAGFPPHVADRLLNHVTGAIQGVAAVYQRHDFLAERKAALDAWATHVVACGEGGGREPENVVALAPRRQRKAGTEGT
ncbi:tyrosine-type recombinase/integrase [Roseomonas sp. BN140053]|uniref:tyrosine-type recombinase/integrase n=1 Tax=Roseomonas sp. BN140053 TaxID=3391898 RepID=UPI0039ED7859